MSNSNHFRSLFPHEPLPCPKLEPLGYILLQGAFTPKLRKNQGEINKGGGDTSTECIADINQSNGSQSVEVCIPKELEDANYVEEKLLSAFRGLSDGEEDQKESNSTITTTSYLASQLPYHNIVSVNVISEKEKSSENKVSITKVRLTYPSAFIARSIASSIRHGKITPSQLFPTATTISMNTTQQNMYIYSSKPIQATQLTMMPLLSPNLAWTKAGPPKFRRLLLTPAQDQTQGASKSTQHQTTVEDIQQQRDETRFVFITNIMEEPSPASSSSSDVDQEKMNAVIDNLDPNIFQDALRQALAPYCKSELYQNSGLELFLPSKQKNASSSSGRNYYKHCHVGTRSPEDAQNMIRELQGRSLDLKLILPTSKTTMNNEQINNEQILTTGKLFLDFADITNRSKKSSNQRKLGNTTNTGNMPGMEEEKGHPPRPECTSLTDHVVVPGLICVPNFISQDEEEVILAALQGPEAPWAPSQRNFSKTGNVKRRVQHYGYVFDYETADVLRNRDDSDAASCPPMPGLPSLYTNNGGIIDDEKLEELCDQAVEDRKGWDLLASVIERVRRFNFYPNLGDDRKEDGIDDASSNNGRRIPINNVNLEQMNINTKEEAKSISFSATNKESSAGMRKFPYLNQITVNEYKPSQGIGSHVDTHSAFGDGLISLSLHGDCVMEFTHVGQVSSSTQSTTSNEEKETNFGTQMRKLVHLPPRSLLLMSGPARYEWEHMIVSRMTDFVKGKVIPRRTRISLTLRTALKIPESDSQGVKSAKPLDFVESDVFPPRWGQYHNRDTVSNEAGELITPSTEKDHVHAVYDAIATQWHHTRGKRGVLWPGATQFLTNLPKGSIVADVGCGDGKYFPAIWEAGSFVIGSDISLPLLKTTIGGGIVTKQSGDTSGPQNRHVREEKSGLNSRPAVLVADCIHVPLRTGSCDAAICIAVMHHLSTTPRRIRCLQELSRIVKPGGTINVQAWALDQEEKSKRKFASSESFVPFFAQPRYLDKVQRENDSKAVDDKDAKISGTKSVAEMYSDAYDGAEYDERKGLIVFQRYCHLYRRGELEHLVQQIDSLELLNSGFESGNYFVILKVKR